MIVETVQSRGVTDVRVLGAMANVPRHEFIPSHLQTQAYSDQPLPLCEGQTISQPYIVALMTALAELGSSDRCLEIGTGSGYQTAVLAELCASVFTIEIREALGQSAQARLSLLGYTPSRICCKIGDGYAGWPEFAPFDAVILTAAPTRIPMTLLAQLAQNGRLIAPIGPADKIQRLEKWVRRRSTNRLADFDRTHVLNVQFVPMQSAAEIGNQETS